MQVSDKYFCIVSKKLCACTSLGMNNLNRSRHSELGSEHTGHTQASYTHYAIPPVITLWRRHDSYFREEEIKA